jgi:hypothetical protein
MGYSPMRESIVRIIREESEDDGKSNKIKNFISKAKPIINRMKFDGVKRINLKYDDFNDVYDVEIYFDKQSQIDNPNIFNKVKRESIKEIGKTFSDYFPFKFIYYIHYQ